ncbi:MAG TPA: AMP-binding protein [Patescibacteria group bacterium]|nr:AMP-binding protein [Patescibacteria group bacterium]
MTHRGPASIIAPRPLDVRERVDRLGRFGRRRAYFWRDGVRWRSRTYAELRARILGASECLTREGLRAGEPILIQGPDHPDWVEALFGAFLAGGVVVPLEAATPEPFRLAVARTVGARLLIAPGDVTTPPGCRRIAPGAWGAGRVGPTSADTPVARAEIVFTSGTTGEPKGVVLTHQNLAADFAPFEGGFRKRERVVSALGELRTLSTLPLSHMFGQAMNVFLPLYMGLTVAFVPPRPRDLIDAAPRLGAWGLFTVPRVLEVLAGEMRRDLAGTRAGAGLETRMTRHHGKPFWLQRLLFREFSRRLGWCFSFVVSGGAALTDPVREFWERAGYLVVQGYGLTETAPIVSVSNPFRRGHGGVGRALAGQEVKIGADGEILVRGANVTPGYFGAEEGTRPGDEAGWWRTGDVGSVDADGQIVIRGRLKDVIVTAEGENVHAADVEEVFRGQPGLLDVAVLGLPYEGGERVHAALILDAGADPDALVGRANARLLPRQRVRDYTVWPDPDFPRTGTGKVRRLELRARILAARRDGPREASTPAASGGVRRLLTRVARVPPERLRPETRLVEDLGLASLDLVEIAAGFEEEFGVALPEELMAVATVGGLEESARQALAGGGGDSRAEPVRSMATGPAAPPAADPADAASASQEGPAPHRAPAMPAWAHSWPARIVRRGLEETAYRAIVFGYARPRVTGLENLARAAPPYLFVSNHHGYLDTGLLKATLPFALRGRIAPGMTTRYQRVWFGETAGTRGRLVIEGLQAGLVELLFAAWPLPETAGFRRSLVFAGELMDRGVSLLIFPEGRHVPEGTMQAFRPGIGVFARELRAPVIPVRVEGTSRVLPDDAWWPRRGRTSLVIGAPMSIEPDADAAEVTRRLEASVRALRAEE